MYYLFLRNNRPRAYYEQIMAKINGYGKYVLNYIHIQIPYTHINTFSILLPGGAIFFNQKYCTQDLRNDTYQSSKHIYDIAEESNRKGKYFPLWGTCLGFQLILTHSAGVEDVRQDCVFMNCSLPVKFEDDKGE